MLKESNCRCVVCQVERSLLNSLSTQIARTHFQALARNYPILNHFDSPADVIAQLHEHERVELVNHKAWNEILHALVDSIAGGTAEEIGQQLLLVAYAPAIHKVYREVCQKFLGLCPEDIAQQAVVCLLETARSEEMQTLNGHLPAALARLQPVDRLPSNNHMELAIGLPLRNQQALNLLLRDLYDPASPRYHQFLTPDQFTQMFGPTAEDYQKLAVALARDR